jgi:hypothetical protein
MKSEEVGWPSVVINDFVQSVDKKSVTDSTSRLQSLHVNFHNFSMRLSHLGYIVTSFGQAELQIAQKAENDLGFICEC